MKLLLLLTLLLTMQAQAHPGPRPKLWRGFTGPAYLAGRLAPRPSQHKLDSLARAARLRKILTQWKTSKKF